MITLAIVLASAVAAPEDALSLDAAIGAVDVSKCSARNPCAGRAEGIEFSVTSRTMVAFKAAESWQLWLTQDEMTDQKSCYLYTDRGWGSARLPEVRLDLSYRVPYVGIGTYPDKPFPSSMMQLRVDQNPLVEYQAGTVLSDPKSALLIRQMKAGKQLRIRFEEWPSREGRSTIIDLGGFSKIYAVADKICTSWL